MPLWIVACLSRLRTQVKRRLLPLILPCQRCLLIFGSALLIRRRMLLSLSRTRSYRESYRLFLKKYICLCPLIANNGRTHPMDALSELRYAVELPLTPAPEFSAVSVERIEDAFDEDFVDYIFSDGSAKIYGEVTNEMPFDMSIEMVIMDENNVPVDIQFPAQEVKGQSGEVVFEITKEDMPKMKDARHIDLNLHLTGRDQSEALKKGQKTTFNLKLKKEGGISI